jgi:hypothetical protein
VQLVVESVVDVDIPFHRFCNLAYNWMRHVKSSAEEGQKKTKWHFLLDP